ncbi:MAG: SDR family oxidoreductase [Clostridia bacterium]|nr:SDR family oxidoreductase [Clostridia bacterium]
MKNVLITGGSRGIGRACVEKFTREGYTVSFIYNNSATAAIELSNLTGAHAIKADVSNPDQVQGAIVDALTTMGSIDILINNAGISLIKLFTDTTDEDYYNIMNTNFGGTFFVTREVSKNMISNHYGRIVNIGSMWGKVGASCEVAYSASKSAIEGFTKALAKELGPSGICVNCIEPGVINTEMNSELDETTLAELKNETPVGKIGDANELAEFIYSIATEKSGFLTGQIIGFDGGFAI